MSFELRIEFSGLCLFVLHRDGKQVAVLMPDARRQPNLATMTHWDGTEAVPHAGYLRFDLGNALPGIQAAPNNSAGPRNEGVRRFDRETVELGLEGAPAAIATDELTFPDFKKIDDGLRVPREMFGDAPPRQLLMRMKLTGGEFVAHSGGSNWTFPGINVDVDEPYQGQFANFATWTRVIDQDSLTVRFTPFGNGRPTSLTLRPQNGIVRLKISNLCAENPLEWPELKIRVIAGEEDKDFRWLYSLLAEPNGALVGADRQLPTGPDGKLPVPILDRTSGAAGIEEDCTGGKIDGDF